MQAQHYASDPLSKHKACANIHMLLNASAAKSKLHMAGRAPLTTEEAQEEMAMVVLEGIDTTAGQLAFALYISCQPAKRFMHWE